MTLVDASHTPDQIPPEPRDSEAGSTKIALPARVQFSLLRQRIILTIRWWFRLPIDEIKERHTQAQIDGLVQLHQKQMETIKTLSRISNNMQQRLQFYEANVPRIRELKRQFDQEQARHAIEANGDPADLNNGILAPKQQRSPLILS